MENSFLAIYLSSIIQKAYFVILFSTSLSTFNSKSLEKKFSSLNIDHASFLPLFSYRITFPLAYAVFLIIFFAHKKFFAND